VLIIKALILFIIGLCLIIYFAEKLVKAVVGTSLAFGISAFILSVIFIGFDPENLFVGSIGSFEQVAGIALGSIIGAAMVAVALAFGITAIFAPMEFTSVSWQVLVVPVAAVCLLSILCLDGELSRSDGVILLTGYSISVLYLLRQTKKGFDITGSGEVAESLEKPSHMSRWKSVILLAISLIAITAGSEMLVRSSEGLISWLNLSDTFFGMTILAFLVSIEELARELPAALKGRGEISFGNVVGSILAFFLFNAGIIALVRPVSVNKQVLLFYLPIASVTTLIVCGFMITRRVGRIAGAILIVLYCLFIFGGYFL
jgi:cation:H+ antiporter